MQCKTTEWNTTGDSTTQNIDTYIIIVFCKNTLWMICIYIHTTYATLHHLQFKIIKHLRIWHIQYTSWLWIEKYTSISVSIIQYRYHVQYASLRTGSVPPSPSSELASNCLRPRFHTARPDGPGRSLWYGWSTASAILSLFFVPSRCLQVERSEVSDPVCRAAIRAN